MFFQEINYDNVGESKLRKCYNLRYLELHYKISCSLNEYFERRLYSNFNSVKG